MPCSVTAMDAICHHSWSQARHLCHGNAGLAQQATASQAALQVQPVGWEPFCINLLVSVTCSVCGLCDINTPTAQEPVLYRMSALPAAAVARQAAVLTITSGRQAARLQCNIHSD